MKTSAKNALLFFTSLNLLSNLACATPVSLRDVAIESATAPNGHGTLFHDSRVDTIDDDLKLKFRRWIPPRPKGVPDAPPPPAPGTLGGPRSGPADIPPPWTPIERPPPRDPTPPRPENAPVKPDWIPIAPDVRPGRGPGTGDDPKSMESYEETGKSRVEAYRVERSGANHRGDTHIVNTAEEAAQYPANRAFQNIRQIPGYQIVENRKLPSDYKTLRNFGSSELGFSFNQQGLITQYVVHPKDQPSSSITRSAYDPEGKFIVFEDAFKDNNDLVRGHIPLNEIGMQNFKHAVLKPKDDDPNVPYDPPKTRNLKAVFLMDIQNKEFWAITRHNYNEAKQPFSEVMTFPSGTPAFDRFMGSPNLRSKITGFSNHREMIGNKDFDKIIVIPSQALGGAEKGKSGGQLTAVLILKEPGGLHVAQRRFAMFSPGSGPCPAQTPAIDIALRER